MRKTPLIAAVSLILCLAAKPSTAATYHLAPEGADTADGSSEHPWATIDHAAGQLHPGDTLLVKEGRYNQSFALKHLHGTPERTITIQAAPNQRAVLDLAHLPNGRGATIEDCRYLTLRHLELCGAASQTGLTIQNSRHLVIEGNVIHNCKSKGIRLGETQESILRGNICCFNDTGIYLGSNSTGNLVEGNICAFGRQSSENADGIATSDSERNTFRFNLLVGNNDDGLDTWTSKRNTIEWNFACANGDLKEGDGNGFKLGGRWKNRVDSPWNGGENVVRNNLSVYNLATGFTDNTSKDNRYEGNIAYGNRNTGPYASQPHSAPEAGEPILARIRSYYAQMIAQEVLRPTLHPLPGGFSMIYALKVWP